MSRSEWASSEDMSHVLALLMPQNRLAIELSMRTGLRISDVLSLTRVQVANGRPTVTEHKTHKRLRIRIPAELQRRILSASGTVYAWEGRDRTKPRSRQAVYKDVVRACKALRLPEHISPHTARKVYAVDLMERSGGDIGVVQRALNHDSSEVTLVYAMSDALTARRLASKRKRKT